MLEKHCYHTLQVNPLVPGHCADTAQLHSCNRCYQDSEAQSAFHTKRKEGPLAIQVKNYMINLLISCQQVH